MTHSAALTKKGTSMCHRALTLQIARQAGPNYNNHTNRATHRPTWLEGASPELSNLRCCSESSITQSACTVKGTTVSNLQPPSPGRVSSASSYCVSHGGRNHTLSGAHFSHKPAPVWFPTCENDGGWGLLFYLWPLQGPGKGRFSQSHPLITPSPANHQASSSTFLQNEGVPPRFTLNPKVWPLPTHSGLTLSRPV